MVVNNSFISGIRGGDIATSLKFPWTYQQWHPVGVFFFPTHRFQSTSYQPPKFIFPKVRGKTTHFRKMMEDPWFTPENGGGPFPLVQALLIPGLYIRHKKTNPSPFRATKNLPSSTSTSTDTSTLVLTHPRLWWYKKAALSQHHSQLHSLAF